MYHTQKVINNPILCTWGLIIQERDRTTSGHFLFDFGMESGARFPFWNSLLLRVLSLLIFLPLQYPRPITGHDWPSQPSLFLEEILEPWSCWVTATHWVDEVLFLFPFHRWGAWGPKAERSVLGSPSICEGACIGPALDSQQCPSLHPAAQCSQPPPRWVF